MIKKCHDRGSDTSPVTLEEFLANAEKCWQFALDAAWDQNRRHPELSRGKCLHERSFLWTLLGTDQAPVFGKACELADSVDNREQMQVLLPEVLEWMKAKYPPSPDHPKFEPGRCFRYETALDNYCSMHIRNAKQPESFLQCPEYFAENLRYIMDKSEREHSCSTLYTATWLNSHPAFLRFFPEEWRRNLEDTLPFGPTMGWQGQFINRRGMLNEKNAARFLETGELPFTRRKSSCSFTAIRKHLDEMGI